MSNQKVMGEMMNRAMTISGTLDSIKDYYGKILRSTRDLKTGACCTLEAFPPYVRSVVELIDEEIMDRYYGCGSPIPPGVEGCTVLDLGCGTGRDVYITSVLAGTTGRVVGVDMTDEQLEVARRYLPSTMERFGFKEPNVEFKKGYIEDLKSIGIEDGTIDIVISNCVINLSPDKKAVFREIFRVLKPGGELYFSDIFTGRRVPEVVSTDPVLMGECLGGAMYIEDFRRLLAEVGCKDYRVVSSRKVDLLDPEIFEKAGMIDFHSLTIRAFKLNDLEDICEDYGQVATYRGTIKGCAHSFTLDNHHLFIKGKPLLVCGNTASMLQKTRFSRHFAIQGDRSVHFGPFTCGPASLKIEEGDTEGGACC